MTVRRELHEIPYVLTNRDRDEIAMYRLALEEQRRKRNEDDKKRQAEADAAERARMGIVLHD